MLYTQSAIIQRTKTNNIVFNFNGDFSDLIEVRTKRCARNLLSSSGSSRCKV